jgi:diaminopimelate epimerase
MNLPFSKMAGAGNDFVVIDNRRGVVPTSCGGLIQSWCDRRFGVGADGVLLVEPTNDAHFRMRYYNADGGEAEMCGNGARCISRFAYLNGIAPARMEFLTAVGRHSAEIIGANVKLSMTDPTGLSLDTALPLRKDTPTVSFLNTGVPHVVEFVESVRTTNIVARGREIRRHERYQPAGTNAMFVELVDAHTFRIRSYERGVEDETLACGTGTVAAAVIGGLKGMFESPTTGITGSGIPLTIHFELNGNTASSVYLQGNAEVTFEGVLTV